MYAMEAKNGSSFGEVSSGVINMIKCECDVNAFGNSLDGMVEREYKNRNCTFDD